jgi:hypothetical protein
MGCIGLETMEVREAKYGKSVPVIQKSFASKGISPGQTWKIYLIASDPDGEMKNIVCTIDQPGVGVYPASFTKIKEENRKELSGYIYLNTQSWDDLTFLNLTLTVQIQDEAGHFSAPAIFPLSFNSRFAQEPAPPGVFQEKDLGPILIRLRTIREGEGPGIFERERH